MSQLTLTILLIILLITFITGCPTGYTHCVWEQTPALMCNEAGVIAKGSTANSRYGYQESNGSIECSNTIFGDPTPGYTQQCCYQTSPLTGPVIPIVGTISCGETIYSYLKDMDEKHYWKLTTNALNDITYTTCTSMFDTRVHVYNDKGEIFSVPYCGAPINSKDPSKTGDDCNEYNCSASIDGKLYNNELFTIPSQLADTYYIQVISFDNNQNGSYTLSVSCNPRPIIFQHLGCYGDTMQNRALSLEIGRPYNIEECYNGCIGYKYFAIQSGTQCFCGDNYTQATQYGTSSDCGPMPGYGADFANALYQRLTVAPTKNPSSAPTKSPTPAPTNNPTSAPTNDPTPTPTDNPSPAPTNNPTLSPTPAPTENPISVPTMSPSHTPSDSPSQPTMYPTTFKPTESSDSSSTAQTTKGASGQLQATLSATSIYKYLHLICNYNEDRDYIAEFVTSINYAKIMSDAIPSSLKTITVTLGKWEKCGIFDFVICNVFNSKLSNIDSECPDYTKSNDNNDDKGQYVAIGTFGIFVIDNDKLNQYKRWIIEEMESDQFKNEFNKNMNNKLNDIGSNKRIRRMLLKYDRFEAVQINVMDPNNATIPTIQIADDDLQGSDKNDSNSTTVIIIVVVIICLLICIIIIVLIIYFKRTNKKNKKNKEIIHLEPEGASIRNNVEMMEIGKEIEGIQGIQKEYVTPNNNENAHNKDDIDIIENINESNETPGDHVNNNNNNVDMDDEDVLEAINEINDEITLGGDDEGGDDYNYNGVGSLSSTRFGQNTSFKTPPPVIADFGNTSAENDVIVGEQQVPGSNEYND